MRKYLNEENFLQKDYMRKHLNEENFLETSFRSLGSLSLTIPDNMLLENRDDSI